MWSIGSAVYAFCDFNVGVQIYFFVKYAICVQIYEVHFVIKRVLSAIGNECISTQNLKALICEYVLVKCK